MNTGSWPYCRDFASWLVFICISKKDSLPPSHRELKKVHQLTPTAAGPCPNKITVHSLDIVIECPLHIGFDVHCPDLTPLNLLNHLFNVFRTRNHISNGAEDTMNGFRYDLPCFNTWYERSICYGAVRAENRYDIVVSFLDSC